MWFLILSSILALCAVAYILRVPLLARVLGQPESRIQRQLGRKNR
jgi:hypothetical protein